MTILWFCDTMFTFDPMVRNTAGHSKAKSQIRNPRSAIRNLFNPVKHVADDGPPGLFYCDALTEDPIIVCFFDGIIFPFQVNPVVTG
jgi:hypothetical protein